MISSLFLKETGLNLASILDEINIEAESKFLVSPFYFSELKDSLHKPSITIFLDYNFCINLYINHDLPCHYKNMSLVGGGITSLDILLKDKKLFNRIRIEGLYISPSLQDIPLLVEELYRQFYMCEFNTLPEHSIQDIFQDYILHLTIFKSEQITSSLNTKNKIKQYNNLKNTFSNSLNQKNTKIHKI